MRTRIIILEEFEWLEAMAQTDLENSGLENLATTIKLDQFLKWSGLVQTGGEAKMLIQSGEVRVNGAQETRRGRKLMAGDRVSVYGDTLTVDLSASASPGFPGA
jgi:ribosome-associated protein